MNYKNVYTEASIRVREKMAAKVTSNLSKNLKDESRMFIKLTKTIPNWKTYLTDKQLEVVDLYLKLLSSSQVDYQLKLAEGTTYHRLFGSPSKGSKERGAYGTLKRVAKMLEQSQRKAK